MTTEQKAKAYDEALERAKKQRADYQKELDKTDKTSQLAGLLRAGISAIDMAFPELAESEDERIRKGLIEIFNSALGQDFLQRKAGLDRDKVIAYLEKQKYDRMKPVYDNQDSFESALEKAWKEYNDSGSRTVDGCEDDYVECAHAKGFREGYLFGLKKQEESEEEDDDFVIYHPLKCNGKYECIPYSFYGSLTSFSDDKDLMDFLRTCFYTEEECEEWIEKQKEEEGYEAIPVESTLEYKLGFKAGKESEKQKDKMTAEEFESSELFQLKLKTKYANGYQDGLAQKEQSITANGLDEEIHRFFDDYIDVHEAKLYGSISERVIPVDCYELTARHFAKWGEKHKGQESTKVEGTTICGQDYKCKKDYKEDTINCRYIKDAIYHCSRDGYLNDQNGVSWSCTPEWFKEYIQSNTEWAEEEKTRFVSGQFLQCKLSFDEFKEDEHYWLEYIGDDMYVGRSDNILNQKFHITPRQLYTLFSQQLEEKQKEPHYTKRNALFDKCVENCDPKTVEEVNKRVDDIMNMSELSAFEQALTNFIGYWEDDEEHWPSQFVKKHGKHILDMAREELEKEQKPICNLTIPAEGESIVETADSELEKELNAFLCGYDREINEEEIATLTNVAEHFYQLGKAERKPTENEKVEMTDFEQSIYDLCPVLGIEEAKATASDLLELAKKILLKTGKVVLASNYPEGCSFEDGFHLGYNEGFNAMKDQKPVEYPEKGNEYWFGFNEGKGTVLDHPEKYGLCKPVECSEEERKLLDSIIDDYEKAAKSFCGYDGKIGLLKAIRDGEYNLSKPTWSEEDSVTLDCAVEVVERAGLPSLAASLKFLPERFKLQPKQEWSDEDAEKAAKEYADENPGIMHENDGSVVDDYDTPYYNFLAGYRWTKSHIHAANTTEWSEEDEEALDMCIDAIPKAWKTKSGILLTKWLKDNIYPQPKQEWNEEDKKLLDFWLDVIDRNDWRMDENFCKASREFINRLKSLRPHLSDEEIKKIRSEEYTKGFNDAAFGGKAWKPSKEQMMALERASTHEYLSAKQFDVLVSLYDQLKKL